MLEEIVWNNEEKFEIFAGSLYVIKKMKDSKQLPDVEEKVWWYGAVLPEPCNAFCVCLAGQGLIPTQYKNLKHTTKLYQNYISPKEQDAKLVKCSGKHFIELFWNQLDLRRKAQQLHGPDVHQNCCSGFWKEFLKEYFLSAEETNAAIVSSGYICSTDWSINWLHYFFMLLWLLICSILLFQELNKKLYWNFTKKNWKLNDALKPFIRSVYVFLGNFVVIHVHLFCKECNMTVKSNFVQLIYNNSQHCSVITN